jgi:hypothetical protein
LDELGGLLFGQAEQLLDARAQTGVGRTLLLLQMTLGVDELVAALVSLLLGALQLRLHLVDVGGDLVPVVTA